MRPSTFGASIDWPSPIGTVHVGEREVAIIRRHERLARNPFHRVEDAQVEHVPGSHLLFDHLATCGLDIDHVLIPDVDCGARCSARGRRREG
jgi:hypothetical protein